MPALKVLWVLAFFSSTTDDHLWSVERSFPTYQTCVRQLDKDAEPGRVYGMCLPCPKCR